MKFSPNFINSTETIYSCEYIKKKKSISLDDEGSFKKETLGKKELISWACSCETSPYANNAIKAVEKME